MCFFFLGLCIIIFWGDYCGTGVGLMNGRGFWGFGVGGLFISEVIFLIGWKIKGNEKRGKLLMKNKRKEEKIVRINL